jgi:hypothetical protein
VRDGAEFRFDETAGRKFEDVVKLAQDAAVLALVFSDGRLPKRFQFFPKIIIARRRGSVKAVSKI